MSHLDIIKEAYDKCGIKYFVKTIPNNKDFQYLFLVPYEERVRRLVENTDLNILLGNRSFLEFCKGEITSY